MERLHLAISALVVAMLGPPAAAQIDVDPAQSRPFTDSAPATRETAPVAPPAIEPAPSEPLIPGFAKGLARPGQREFVQDAAGLLHPDDRTSIQQICDKLLTDKATPIIVVTIESMARHGGRGMRIELFARVLFDQWQIGHATLDGKEWNTGILLLVSVSDRKARIELGAGWRHEKDKLCRQIMDEQIIPCFREGNFSGGIVAGVEALDKMARGDKVPRPRRPAWHYLLGAGVIALVVWTGVSLIRRGRGGWAWVFWAALFAVIGAILYHFLTSAARGSRCGGFSGGFSGGSFGGGFSGGGGATGSW